MNYQNNVGRLREAILREQAFTATERPVLMLSDESGRFESLALE